VQTALVSQTLPTFTELNSWKTYSLVLICTCSALILMFGWLFWTLRRQKATDFAKNLAVCMLAYNVFVLARFFLVYNVVDDYMDASKSVTGFDRFLAILWALCIVVSLIAFNIGNWYFGFHYFKCASEMEYIIDMDSDKSQDALQAQ
jgi:glucose uptake protein GlcU